MPTPIVIFRFADYAAQIPETAKASIPPFFTVFNPGGGDNWQDNVLNVISNTASGAVNEAVQVTITNLNADSGTVQIVPDSAPAFEAQFTIEYSIQP
jgi:hypothetical protein